MKSKPSQLQLKQVKTSLRYAEDLCFAFVSADAADGKGTEKTKRHRTGDRSHEDRRQVGAELPDERVGRQNKCPALWRKAQYPHHPQEVKGDVALFWDCLPWPENDSAYVKTCFQQIDIDFKLKRVFSRSTD